MGGAGLYLWLTLLCLLSVAVLFGMGWGLSVWGRRRERLARERRRQARVDAEAAEGDAP